jgi:DHA1 family quinolone resistance protein-like MFS transporter
MKVNNLIKILTFSDVLIVSGWGLINPIFAVYVTDHIEGGNIELVGLAVCVYWVLRASFQIPFSRFVDSHKGEVDDFLVMAVGSFLMSLMPFLYMFALKPVHVLLLQGVTGFASAMVSPGWLAIFTRHVEKDAEAQAWGFYNASVGYSIALASALSGFMAINFGYKTLYFIVGVICTFGSTFLFFVYQDLRKGERVRG